MQAKGSKLLASALSEAAPTPFWTDRPERPSSTDPLTTGTDADLAVIGGGYSGLWTALLAKERDPGLDVVLIESGLCGHAASGRNGGFCAASLTHGLANGVDRFPDEIGDLERLGRKNLDEIEDAIRRYDIDCDFERTGEMEVATAPHELEWLQESHDAAVDLGYRSELLDARGAQNMVHSPTYLGGRWDRDGVAMLDPARLAWGLRRACLEKGVRIFEGTPVQRISKTPGALDLHTPHGEVRAPRVALCTSAFQGPLAKVSRHVVPVYDYALMTEPLTSQQLESIGWVGRMGLGDASYRFHYYRLTSDNRILFGGYDAIYHFGSKIAPGLECNEATFETLAQHFFQTFPQLDGLRFTHRWGGIIDTCGRFCAFFGSAFKGKLAYAAGYTGLGVGATRFGAEVMLDRLWNLDTERTRLRMVRSRPLPLPPEPLRSAGIQLTRWSMARADAHQGRRNLWLKTMELTGLGFDS
ncbi:NAD(P)/FAD-dependent oxidoreductase [Nocardia sp. NBC_01327]|uniref:NAD(P)/FAD-dependent oxidoreductase n=1 Tax=Nocardia sp. NBC_01327 TaxID=2903593 RepID=UPI002E12E130|nr:FAD-binding oxidoreductase [Nocardia sp. NBC_01327]